MFLEKLDKENSTGEDGIINGQGYVVTDRNSLLEKLKIFQEAVSLSEA